MSDLDQVLQYREKVEQAQRRVAMAEGGLRRAMKELAERFKCKSVLIGQKTLVTLKARRLKSQQEAEDKLEAFEDKWKEHLCR